MQLIEAFQAKGIQLETDVYLSEYTSLRIGGKAKYFVTIRCLQDVAEAIRIATEYQIPYYVLGNGSNTLALDYGVDGIILYASQDFSKIQLIDETTITCEAGALLKDVCLFALANSLEGMEYFYGIPASVGGAIYMNAGAYDGEIKNVIKDCTFLTSSGQQLSFEKEQLDLSYRHSYFMGHKSFILSATFQLKKGDQKEIENKMNDFLNRRKTKQPLEYPSAGSTFKRPKYQYASALIDECGLKGYRINDAMVSTKHAGFVINVGNATSADFITLIEYIQSIVYLKKGIMLHPEVQILK